MWMYQRLSVLTCDKLLLLLTKNFSFFLVPEALILLYLEGCFKMDRYYSKQYSLMSVEKEPLSSQVMTLSEKVDIT